MSGKRLTLKILSFLILTDILETVAQFYFKKTAIPQTAFVINSLGDVIHFSKSVASSPFLWLGLLCVLSVFILWAAILSKIDLSVAVPVASFSYILVPLVSIILLHEKISLLRWAGIFFIILGVISVSISSREKESI